MQNRNSNAETAANSSTPDDVKTSSQTIAKPDVMRILFVGAKLKIYFNPRNINNVTFEVRAIVDGCCVVFLTAKGNYKMERIEYFQMLYKDGLLSCA